jgi:hypothetical protein
VEVLEASLKDSDQEFGLVSFVSRMMFLDNISCKEQILVVLRCGLHTKRY